jgi:hypothetical protein
MSERKRDSIDIAADEHAARKDARWERDHGGAVPAGEARARARLRRAEGRDTADYWDAYAAEVDSWEEDGS